MKQRTLLKTAASSAALLLVLAACGEDRTDTVSTGNDGEGGSGTQSPTTVKVPARIRIARTGGSGNTSPQASTVAADEAAGGSTKMSAPYMMGRITYAAGLGLAEITGARGSWFFPKDGHVVSDEQKQALVTAFGLTGTWAPLPADWGGGEAVGPTDGSGANITISVDAMRSWWFSPGPIPGQTVEACVTSVDAAGQEVTECPTPTPPPNVPDKATAEAKARDLFATMGLDPAQFELETYADEWGSWVTGWLLLDGQRAPMTMYVGFGAEGAITGAGGFLARPIQGDQYDLVGISKGIERLNDQQFGWMGMGGAYAKSSVADDTLVGGDAVAVGEGTDSSDSTSTDVLADPPLQIDPTPCLIEIRPTTELASNEGGTESPEPIDPATTAPETAAPAATTIAPPPNGCPPYVEPEPITITLTGVTTGFTMVWDADETVWLLPAYTFTDDQGGQYSVIAIDDAFIELPEALPMPEPLPAEEVTDPAVPVEVDQASADKLLGLTEAEATKLAEEYRWTSRVIARDGESLPVTMDYRTDRVNFSIEAGVVTAVSLG